MYSLQSSLKRMAQAVKIFTYFSVKYFIGRFNRHSKLWQACSLIWRKILWADFLALRGKLVKWHLPLWNAMIKPMSVLYLLQEGQFDMEWFSVLLNILYLKLQNQSLISVSWSGLNVEVKTKGDKTKTNRKKHYYQQKILYENVVTYIEIILHETENSECLNIKKIHTFEDAK